MKKTRIVILAAGKGTRMRQDIPKALTPVAGKPILQHLVESIRESGIEEVPIIVKSPDQEPLCEAFGTECEYATQDDQLGTAHAAKMAKEAVGDADQMIVLYGDHPFISAKTLGALVELHASSESPLSMMTVRVPGFDGWRQTFWHWGRILRDGDGHVMGIKEFKDAMDDERAITEVNPSLFCFDTNWFFENVEQVKNENSQEEYYLTDLVELAVVQGHRIPTVEMPPEEAVGINSQEERAIAEELLANRS